MVEMDEKLIVWQLEIPGEGENLGLYRTADAAKHYVGDFEDDWSVTWKSRTISGDDLPDGWYCETDDGELWYIIYPIEVL